MAAEARSEAAPAKVNLYLHICGQRADGYHLLDSLAVFPPIGDRVWAEPGPGLSLSMAGPFGDTLPIDADNLVLRAASELARANGFRAGAALRLDKNLPVASGIGGGSSDAAATLRVLSKIWEIEIPSDIAPALGADVPVCMRPGAQFMGGIGDVLRPAPPLPPAWIVLVNPIRTVPTGQVFAGLINKDNPSATPAPQLREFNDLIGWLKTQRNDLQPPAIALCPEIQTVLDALATAPLARMSGSGATCFALHRSQAEADEMAEAIRADQPDWWVASAPLQAPN
ncbi:MAG: 4-(cytidine 5'-diphospho)-2-C-methyl-D-erythritol kinase [Pseudomonadota bacterium]